MKANITPISRTFWSKSGLAAARPAATGLRNGSLWCSTDTKDIDQVQAGAWVTIFEYAALAGAVATHTAIATAHQDAPALIATHAGVSDAHHVAMTEALVKGYIASFWEATIALFQANVASGDFSGGTGGVNDNNTAAEGKTDTATTYAEIDYGFEVFIRRWRQFGHASNVGDGVWKIQYYDEFLATWVDWVTGIATRASADWSDYTTETIVRTQKVRLVCTTVDSESRSYIGELEVIF